MNRGIIVRSCGNIRTHRRIRRNKADPHSPDAIGREQNGRIGGSHDSKSSVDTHGNGLATVTSIGIVRQQMGKVSTAVRSAAMSHIEQRRPTILGRGKMRTKLAKIVVILLLSGSGDARPQKTESSKPQVTRVNVEEWKPVQPSSPPQDIREESRYRWNSGNSRIPYINHYRGNIDPFLNGEVSVDESKKTKPRVTRPSDAETFRNSPIFPIVGDSSRSFVSNAAESSARYKHFVRKLGESVGDGGQRVSNTFNENSARPRNSFHRQAKVPVFRVDSGSFGTPSSKNSNRRFDSVYSRDRPPNSQSPYFRNQMTLDPSSDFGKWRDQAPRRPDIDSNSSQSGPASSHRPFSDRRAEFSVASDRHSIKVESSTEFDHVAAIKKITGTLTRENSESNQDFRDDVQSVVSFSHDSGFSDRHRDRKHSNATRFRQPSNGQPNRKKNGQNKIVPTKILVNKNNASAPNTHLKNWPNGAIQNVDDLKNYEKYTTLGDNSNFEKPVPPIDTGVDHLVPIVSPSLHEIVHWLNVPAFATNGSHVVESDQVNQPISLVFDPIYQNLHPNKPFGPSTLQTLKPAFVYPMNSRPSYTTEKLPVWLGNALPKNKTTYPQTQVSQNTVVHLINTDSRKPNRTVIATKLPVDSGRPVLSGSLVPVSGLSSAVGSSSLGPNAYPPSLLLSQLSGTSSTTVKPGPNVHIGFTSYEEKNKTSDPQEPQAPLVTYDQRCPTILINSYTRINNTVQSKEGCTDLNIIINSHVFNTNMFKSTPSPVDVQSNPEIYQTYGENDKYVGPVHAAPSYHQPAPMYQSSSSPQWPPSSYYIPQKNPLTSVPQGNDVSSEVQSVEVFQGAQISISNAQNDASSFVEAAPIESSAEEFDESESLDDGPHSGLLQSTSIVSESESDQANNAPGLNSAVQSADATDVSDLASSSDSASSLAESLSPVSSSNNSDDDDDDDDDDFDLSPTGVMESIASVFTYFTFVNPLHYGFFSLAAAPFTALAAGILGIFTFLFPWMFPSSFNFSRASSNDATSFWQNIEEVVWQSIDKYGRLNEWKSKRKKRKR